MIFNAEPWQWQPELCPADQDMVEWLIANKRNKWFAGTLLHMGPGAHHRVPRTASALGLECVSLTVSEDEHFMAPTLDGYRCLLQNIWNYEPKEEFQFMTIFHIGEEAWRWGEIDYPKLDALISKVSVGGKVFFYIKSSARDRQIGYFNHAWLSANLLSARIDQYKSLIVAERI